MNRQTLRHTAALVLSFLLLVLSPSRADVDVAPAARPVVPEGHYLNPLGIDLADPDVLHHQGTYYLYATSFPNLGYKVWTSRDLINWVEQEELAFAKDHLTWGRENFWAPDVIEHEGKFYLYYSAVGPVGVGRSSHRICVARSDSPLGPFVDVRAPLLEIGRAVIDAEVFVDVDGRAYLYYALDHSENRQRNGRRQSELWVVEMGADRVSVAGKPVFCLKASQPWEGNPDLEDTWTEAAHVFRHKDTYVMTYSARVFSDPLYAVGYATSKSPLGPWTKAEENPILRRGGRVSGPGHNSIAPSPDGRELFIVYHTHKDVQGGHLRELNVDRLFVEETPAGSVKLRVAGPTRTPQPMPSGADATPEPTLQAEPAGAAAP